MNNTNEEYNIKRLRRHTIARPASALALLTDSMDCDEENEDYRLDRISNILSSLIQEANEAVSTSPTNSRSCSIPLVRKSSSSLSSDQQRYHKKRSSYRSTTRPLSYPSGLRRSKTPSYTSINTANGNNIFGNRTSNTSKKSSIYASKQNQQSTESSLTKSFERLNSSMAIIDSLSRDLAVSEILQNSDKKHVVTSTNTLNIEHEISSSENFVQQNRSKHSSVNQGSSNTKITRKPMSFDPRLSALILLPLLHVPHILIATAFDTLSTHDTGISSSTAGSKLSGLFIWAFILAISNLMVDKAVVTVPLPVEHLSKKRSTPNSIMNVLPGSFTESKSMQPKNKKRNTNKRNMSYCIDRQSQLMQPMHQQQSKKQQNLNYENSAVHMQHLLSHPNVNLLKPKGLTLQRRNSL